MKCLLKLFSVLFIILVLTAGPVKELWAEEVYSGIYQISSEELCIKNERAAVVPLGSFKSIYFATYLGNETAVNFGEQLSGNARTVYNSLKTLSVDNNILQIALSKKVTFTSVTNSPTEEELEGALEEIRRFTQMAIDAYSRDFPENYWLDIESSYYNFSYFGKNQNGKYVWEITNLSYNAAVDSEYTGEISTYESDLNKAFKAFKVQGTTRYEKLTSIFKQLCDNVVYNNKRYSYQVYGTFVTKNAVCSGYAKAFKMLCDRENIPCILVTGVAINVSGKSEDHMWNAVKMEDGKWYYVDVTWGDSTKIIYDFFLAGKDTKIASLGNKTFSATHLPSGDFSSTRYFIFKYPEIASHAFDPDSISVTTTPVPTPTPVPVENPEIGDANRDGNINAEDALIVLRVAAKQMNSTNEIFIYGDMSGNCILNAEDALLILKHSAKLS